MDPAMNVDQASASFEAQPLILLILACLQPSSYASVVRGIISGLAALDLLLSDT